MADIESLLNRWQTAGALDAEAAARIRAFSPDHYGAARTVGRAELPTTLGGLLVHCADHTQRHVGQGVTTAKVILAMRSSEPSSSGAT